MSPFVFMAAAARDNATKFINDAVLLLSFCHNM